MKAEVTANALEKASARARERRPKVERAGDDSYVVTCGEGHRHGVSFDRRGDRLFAECDPSACPSRVLCYHAGAAYQFFQIDQLRPGDRVLVNELEGPVWHRFYALDEKGFVCTFEVPEGFNSQ